MSGFGRLKNLIPQPTPAKELSQKTGAQNQPPNQPLRESAATPSAATPGPAKPLEPKTFIRPAEKTPFPPRTPEAPFQKPKEVPQEKKLSEILEQEERARTSFLERVEGTVRPSESRATIPPLAPQPSASTEIIRPVPAKPALSEMLWARILASVFIVAMLGGISFVWYWYLNRPTQPPIPPPPPPPAECSVSADCPAGKVCINNICTISQGPSPVDVPISLISADSERRIPFTSAEDLTNTIQQTLGESFEAQKIVRIIPIDTTENKVVVLRKFFEIMGIQTVQELFTKLEENFTLFLYPTTEDNRLGFVVKIRDKNNLSSLLTAWERMMPNDFRGFFNLMSQAQTPSYFQSATYRTANLRFHPFGEENLGIYYAVLTFENSDYFIFASSRKSLEKTMDNITRDVSIAAPLVSERIIRKTPVRSVSEINTVVIHSVFNQDTRKTYNIEEIILKYKKSGAAPHYLVGRDGSIYRLVPTKVIAYHTTGYVPGTKKTYNRVSIGIELVYTDEEPPNKAQYKALAQLVKYIQQRYPNITADKIKGHSEINTSKIDPWNFSWTDFRRYLELE